MAKKPTPAKPPVKAKPPAKPPAKPLTKKQASKIEGWCEHKDCGGFGA